MNHRFGAWLCALGLHAWTPWLRLPNGSDMTMCTRCHHEEQYDHAG